MADMSGAAGLATVATTIGGSLRMSEALLDREP